MESPPNHMHTPFRDAVCQRKPPDALNLDRFETKLNKNKSKIKLFGGGGVGEYIKEKRKWLDKNRIMLTKVRMRLIFKT